MTIFMTHKFKQTNKSVCFLRLRSFLVCRRQSNVAFSDEDKSIIKYYRLDKGYTTTQLMREFPEKEWTKGGLDTLLPLIDLAGSIYAKHTLDLHWTDDQHLPLNPQIQKH